VKLDSRLVADVPATHAIGWGPTEPGSRPGTSGTMLNPCSRAIFRDCDSRVQRAWASWILEVALVVLYWNVGYSTLSGAVRRRPLACGYGAARERVEIHQHAEGDRG
jgi:hypothetical protein